MSEEMEISFKGMNLLVEFTCESVNDMYSPHQTVGVDLISIMEINSLGFLDEVDLTSTELNQIACDVATRCADEIKGVVH